MTEVRGSAGWRDAARDRMVRARGIARNWQSSFHIHADAGLALEQDAERHGVGDECRLACFIAGSISNGTARAGHCRRGLRLDDAFWVLLL